MWIFLIGRFWPWPWTFTLISQKWTVNWAQTDVRNHWQISWKSDLHFSRNQTKRNEANKLAWSQYLLAEVTALQSGVLTTLQRARIDIDRRPTDRQTDNSHKWTCLEVASPCSAVTTSLIGSASTRRPHQHRRQPASQPDTINSRCIISTAWPANSCPSPSVRPSVCLSTPLTADCHVTSVNAVFSRNSRKSRP